MRPLALLAASVFALAAPASAQLLVTGPPAMAVEAERPIAVQRVDVEARIVGHLAETSMTLVFHNPNGRVLAGDLTFPLPPGAAVSGYALDVDGVLVDGVVVDKPKARQVFEAEVRKGVDPGLVERVAGAAFRTRVFPLPAGGTRTVRVSWVDELDRSGPAPRYHLPLAFGERIPQARVRIDAVRASSARVVGEGLDGLDFRAWEDRLVAETELREARLAAPIAVELPPLDARPVAVERAPDGSVIFAVHADVPAPAARPTPPSRVALLWDASLSRAGADRSREFAALRAWSDSLRRPVRVDAVAFSHAPRPSVRFELPGQLDALLDHLEGVVYDGGTALGPLPGAVPRDAEAALLFSDGVGNLGRPELPSFPVPVYALSEAAVANTDALRALALQSGGAWFDLRRTEPTRVAAAIGQAPFAFRGATGSGIGEAYPRVAEPVDGPFAFVGRLEGERATVELRFGRPGSEAVRRFEVHAEDAVEGTLLQRYWAQKKVADLAVGGRRNEAAMAAVGKRYGIVTPGTSLLVLERFDQYLEHEVRPPASLADFRARWDEAMAQRAAEKQAEDAGKLERIVALWQERVAWWEREFDLSPTQPEAKPAKAGQAAESRRANRADAEREAMPAMASEEEADDSGVFEAEPPPAGGAATKKKEAGAPEAPAASIALKAWDPDTPYLQAMRVAADPEAAYLEQRPAWGSSPAFFLDAFDFFAERRPELALRVLSNIVELDLEDPALLRVFARRLVQIGELDLAIATFERVAELRPDEPQSHRDLGLALAARADARAAGQRGAALSDAQAALDALATVVLDDWERFAEIELIALVEYNDVLQRAGDWGDLRVDLDPRLLRHLDMDVRIVMSWDADATDMDLHVLEPSGEEAYYSHNRTRIGGRVSRDFTQGYGPEEYTIRRAMPGEYVIRTKFFGSSAAQLQGAVTLTVDLYTDYGRPTQKHECLTLRLTDAKEEFTVGTVSFGGPAPRKVTR